MPPAHDPPGMHSVTKHTSSTMRNEQRRVERRRATTAGEGAAGVHAPHWDVWRKHVHGRNIATRARNTRVRQRCRHDAHYGRHTTSHERPPRTQPMARGTGDALVRPHSSTAHSAAAAAAAPRDGTARTRSTHKNHRRALRRGARGHTASGRQASAPSRGRR